MEFERSPRTAYNLLEYSGTKRELEFSFPIIDRVRFQVPTIWIKSNLPGKGLIVLPLMRNPKYSNSSLIEFHFLYLSLILYLWHCAKNHSKLLLCCSNVWPKTKISSTKTTHSANKLSCKTSSITRWNSAHDFRAPNGERLDWKSPRGVEKAVSWRSRESLRLYLIEALCAVKRR